MFGISLLSFIRFFMESSCFN